MTGWYLACRRPCVQSPGASLPQIIVVVIIIISNNNHYSKMLTGAKGLSTDLAHEALLARALL